AFRGALTVLLQQVDRESAKEKDPSRLLALQRRSRQLGSALSDVQDLYRLLDAHIAASPEQKTVIETQRRALDKEVDSLLSEGEGTYERARYLMIGATVFGTLISLVLSLLLTRAITRPLQNAAELAQAMARGDLTHRLQLAQTDEIGRLCQAVDSVTCTLAR